MISASEARQEVKKKKQEREDRVLKSILDTINDAINQELYHCYFYEHVSKELIEKFELLGYQVTESIDRNSTVFKFSWAEKNKQ